MKPLNRIQKNALKAAMAGNGLKRHVGGQWLPWGPTEEKHGYFGIVTVRALVARGLLVPYGSDAIYRAVTVSGDDARAAIAYAERRDLDGIEKSIARAHGKKGAT
jgi:hypothetical protein